MNKLTNAAAEQLVIGSCIKYPDALDAIVEQVAASDFADTRAGQIYAALCRIALAGKCGSVALVEDLRDSGELDAVGGDRAIAYLENKARKNVELIKEAAEVITALSKRRDQAAAARRIAEKIVDGDDPSIEIHTLTSGQTNNTGWADLGSVLSAIMSGTHKRLEPTLLQRCDGASLLYAGRLNWLAAPPESMKTWLSILTCVQVMESGQPAVYIDYEESEPTSCTERIVSIALGRGHGIDAIRTWLQGTDERPQLFYYRSAATPFDSAARAQVLRLIKTYDVPFVVIDGVAAAMGAHNPPLEEDKARDVNMWLAGNVWPFVAAGAGVLCNDHVSKASANAETGSYTSRSPRGSGAKLAAVSGSALMAVVREPGSAWTKGIVDLFAVKDRPGRIKVVTRSGKRLAGILTSTPMPNQVIECSRVEVLSPEQAAEAAAEKRWDLIAAEQITKLLNELGKPVAKTELKDLLNERRRNGGGKGWKGETLVKGIAFLVEYGYVVVSKDGRSETLALVKTYKAELGTTHADDVNQPIGGEPF